MSVSLHWRPVNVHGAPLAYALKRVIGTDQRRWTVNDIPYLTGLKDAGVHSADELIDAIEKYGEVETYGVS